MPTLADLLFGIDSHVTQKCEFCGKTAETSGWTGLCDRRCYYGLSDLIELYETGKRSEPDPRVIAYFTLYPEPTHSFMNEKTLSYLKRVPESA